MALKASIDLEAESQISVQVNHSTLYRDVFIWIFCILVLPILILIALYLIKMPVSSSETEYLLSNNSLNETNTLLRRISLKKYNKSICNDGSPASYYIRKTNSKTWIILLEGGYFCYNSETCDQRVRASFNLTSSKLNREFKTGKGILSTSMDENKYWSDANLVDIPYCSSDLWIGNKYSSDSNEFSFMGSQIIEDVISDLLEQFEMNRSELVYLVGVSAGGIGIIMNSHKIELKLRKNVPHAKVKLILDSAWLLDLPYSYLCNNVDDNDCLIKRIMIDSISYWNASLECDLTNILECFLLEKLINNVKIPAFVIQSLFDETQLIEQFKKYSLREQISNLEAFLSSINNLNERLVESISNLKNFFVPSCIQHMIVNRQDWSSFQIDKINLDEAIYKWSNETDMGLIEKCEFPNCNSLCPRINHPDTNKIINLIEYFNYFGMITYEDIASRMKISITYAKKISYKRIMKSLFSN